VLSAQRGTALDFGPSHVPEKVLCQGALGTYAVGYTGTPRGTGSALMGRLLLIESNAGAHVVAAR
jgi:hypothetical protein